MFSFIVTRISLHIYMERHYHATLLDFNRVDFTSLDDQKTAQLSLLKKHASENLYVSPRLQSSAQRTGRPVVDPLSTCPRSRDPWKEVFE